MSTNHKSRPLRTSSRRNPRISKPHREARPNLSINTSFTRDDTSLPKQIYPSNVVRQHNFVSLDDIKALSNKPTEDDIAVSCEAPESFLHVREGAQRFVTGERSRPNDATHRIVLSSERGPPPPYKEGAIAKSTNRGLQSHPNAGVPPRTERRRNTRQRGPLKVNTAISPVVRDIEIGLAVSSTAIRERKYDLESAVPRSQTSLNNTSSPRSAKTPTIVITPADAEFEFGLKDMAARPTSSIYSRYTSGNPRTGRYDHTPPVPPLPSSTYQRGSTYKRRRCEFPDLPIPDEALPEYSPSPQISQIASVYNCSDEGDGYSLRSPTIVNADRMSSQNYVPTPRRSRGWWNFLTSPFSASSNKHFFTNESPPAARKNQREAPHLDIAVASPLGDIFADRSAEGNELRSAPPTESSRQSFRSRLFPKPRRSDTAPGALDLGDAEKVNIYRTPSQGAASSYYDQSRRYPSVMAPSATRSLKNGPEQNWSPSQSVYRGSLATSAEDQESKDGGFASMEIPLGGEAASYYDPTLSYPNGRGRTLQRANARNQDDSATTSELSEGTSRGGTSEAPSNPRKASMILDTGLHQAKGEVGAQASSHQNSSRIEIHDDNDNFTISGHVTDDEDSTKQSTTGYPEPAAGSGPMDTNAESLNDKDKRGLLYKSDHDESGTPTRTQQRQWYRRFVLLLVGCGTLLLVLLIVLLALLVPVRSDGTPVQARWLNLTGYPPIPTGVLTVIGMDQNKAVDGCVTPGALWSCKVPPGHRLSTARSDQPNFRFEITFRNGTVPSNGTLLQQSSSVNPTRNSSLTTSGGMLARRGLYPSIPPPPSSEDQAFLGRTSDDVSWPYEGEDTPFYISLLNPVSLQPAREPRLDKRTFKYPYPSSSDGSSRDPPSSSSGDDASSTTSAPTGARDVPSPSLRVDGEPEPPQLYPFALSQPLKLFNRGQNSEHYGFYTYFDRSLYLAGLSNDSSTMNSSITGTVADIPLVEASAVCTWSQTRLLVKIFTRKPGVAALTPSRHAADIPAINSTADDMKTPGSFPYAVTVIIDRHGGDSAKKGVYCYGLDEEHRIMEGVHTWIDENRAFQGDIVRPASIPTNSGMKDDKHDNGELGIDGGTSGCACQWNN